MGWTTETDGRALQRIAALLLALAGLADRAGGMPFPVRFTVLAILRRAEAIAWTFAIETASVSPGGRASPCPPPCATPISLDDGPAGAVRLALGFRMLATIVAVWAARLLARAAMRPTATRVSSLTRARLSLGWQNAAAPTAPDTS